MIGLQKILKKNHSIVITLFALTAAFIIITPSLSQANIHVHSSETEERTYYALIAGCMRFQNQSWNIAAENTTVEHFHRFIYDALLQSKNWEKENIVFLTDEQATRQTILGTLNNFSKKVGSNDVFLFSFHSHGNQIPDEDGDEAIYNINDQFDEVIIPYDIDMKNNKLINYISDDELTTKLNDFSCEAILVNIEACLSGGFSEDLIEHSHESNTSNRMILLSTPNNNLEWIHPLAAWGWMSSLGLILSSSFSDRNHDGWISAEEASFFASPLYTLRSYTWIHLIPFLSSSIGAYILLTILDQNIKKTTIPSTLLIMISFITGISMVTIKEIISYQQTGYHSSNKAICVDHYPGELLLIQR